MFRNTVNIVLRMCEFEIKSLNHYYYVCLVGENGDFLRHFISYTRNMYATFHTLLWSYGVYCAYFHCYAMWINFMKDFLAPLMTFTIILFQSPMQYSAAINFLNELYRKCLLLFERHGLACFFFDIFIDVNYPIIFIVFFRDF